VAAAMRETTMGLLLISAVLSALVGCDHKSEKKTTADSTEHSRQDMLIGYDLLAYTLSEESRLSTLNLFKNLTFKSPNKAIENMMQTLSDASKRRASELTKLRRLAPDVTDKPTEESPIGDAITAVSKDIGKSEMMSRDGGFDIRFILLQAQATRMVTAIATATARFDPNRERKVWLKKVAAEYEGYRDEIVKYAGGNRDEQ
jgi:hypothetical protein